MRMPRIISDKDLLEALDCAHPGLESVGEALADDDIDSAKERLIEYCRHREVTSQRGEFLCKRLASRDWLAVAHPEDIPERLYSTQVMTQNDHHEFVELAQEYIETGNDRYAQDCVVRMLDWLDATGPLPTELSTTTLFFCGNSVDCMRSRSGFRALRAAGQRPGGP